MAPSFKRGVLVTVRGGSRGALGEALAADRAFAAALQKFAATGDASGMPVEITLPPVEWALPAPAGNQTARSHPRDRSAR